jgi:hypothetical protein
MVPYGCPSCLSSSQSLFPCALQRVLSCLKRDLWRKLRYKPVDNLDIMCYTSGDTRHAIRTLDYTTAKDSVISALLKQLRLTILHHYGILLMLRETTRRQCYSRRDGDDSML